MAFGEFQNRPDRHGQWIVIPYDGDPAVQLFLPARDTGSRNDPVVFWKGWLTPNAVADWLGAAFALVDGDPRCLSEVWSTQSAPPQTYEKSTIGALIDDLGKVNKDAIVALSVQQRPGTEARFYVWGDLRQAPSPAGMPVDLANGAVSEVGVRVAPGDLRESTGKAIIGNLLKKSSNIKLKTDEIEDLLQQLESKLLHWR